MPPRTNQFQRLVAIIREHIGPDATVEESAMVTPYDGSAAREVDVLVTGTMGGQGVSFGIEATSGARRATITWVEGVLQKHEQLPTVLILYSKSGFSDGALRAARLRGVPTYTQAQLGNDEPDAKILAGLRTIWPKAIRLTPEDVRVAVRGPDGIVVLDLQGDHPTFLSDGTALGFTLRQVVVNKLQAEMPAVANQLDLSKVSESRTARFEVEWNPALIVVNGEETPVFLHVVGDPAAVVYPVIAIGAAGSVEIEVQEVKPQAARVGEIAVLFGEFTMLGTPALFVASATKEGVKVTVDIETKRFTKQVEGVDATVDNPEPGEPGRSS